MAASRYLAKQWVAKAENDLLCADNNLNADRTPYDAVCFHCQQAAEKCLKAFLVFHECRHPLTHDLLLLLEQISLIAPEVEDLRDVLVILLPYAVEVRYPDDQMTPAKADAQEARQASQTVFDWIKNHCSDLF